MCVGQRVRESACVCRAREWVSAWGVYVRDARVRNYLQPNVCVYECVRERPCSSVLPPNVDLGYFPGNILGPARRIEGRSEILAHNSTDDRQRQAQKQQ